MGVAGQARDVFVPPKDGDVILAGGFFEMQFDSTMSRRTRASTSKRFMNGFCRFDNWLNHISFIVYAFCKEQLIG